MSRIIKRVPWTVQPQYAAPLTNSLNLGFVIAPWLGVGSIDLVSKQPLTKQAAGTTGVLKPTSGGLGLYYSSAASYAQYITSSSFTPGTGDFAVGLSGTFERVASKVLYPLSSFTNSSGASQWRFEPNSPDDSATTQGAMCFLTYDGAITLVGVTGAFADGEYANFLFVRRGTTHELWKNGILLATATGTARNITTSPTIGFGGAPTYQNTAGGTRTLGYGVNGTVNPSLASSLSGNPWQIFQDRPIYIWAPAAAGGDATLALTGAAGTGAAGLLVPGFSLSVAGVSATGEGGALTPSIATSLTGVAGTGAAGLLVLGFSLSLAGVSATGAVGTLAPVSGTTVALTGVAGTGAAGLLVPGFSLSLAGVSATGAAGILVPGISLSIVGVSATSAVGTLSPSTGTFVALSGVAGTGQYGSLAPSFALNLSGVSATGYAGSLFPPLSGGVLRPTELFIERGYSEAFIERGYSEAFIERGYSEALIESKPKESFIEAA